MHSHASWQVYQKIKQGMIENAEKRQRHNRPSWPNMDLSFRNAQTLQCHIHNVSIQTKYHAHDAGRGTDNTV